MNEITSDNIPGQLGDLLRQMLRHAYAFGPSPGHMSALVEEVTLSHVRHVQATEAMLAEVGTLIFKVAVLEFAAKEAPSNDKPIVGDCVDVITLDQELRKLLLRVEALEAERDARRPSSRVETADCDGREHVTISVPLRPPTLREAFEAGYRMGYGNGLVDADEGEDRDDSPLDAFDLWLNPESGVPFGDDEEDIVIDGPGCVERDDGDGTSGRACSYCGRWVGEPHMPECTDRRLDEIGEGEE